LSFQLGDLQLARAPWTEAGLCEELTLFLPDGAALTMRSVHFSGDLQGRIRTREVDPAQEAFLAESSAVLRVRPWRTGDRYRPLGAPGSATLQDLFVNRKIPAARRSLLPIVTRQSGEILWVPGLPPAEKSKMTTDSVTGLHLTYETGTYTVRP
jgi:tRNA(Ile)-lysidine synthase